MIQRQDHAFDQDQRTEARGPMETPTQGSNRQGHDATGEKEPDDRVQKFDANEDSRLLDAGFILISLDRVSRMICGLSTRSAFFTTGECVGLSLPFPAR